MILELVQILSVILLFISQSFFVTLAWLTIILLHVINARNEILAIVIIWIFLLARVVVAVVVLVNFFIVLLEFLFRIFVLDVKRHLILFHLCEKTNLNSKFDGITSSIVKYLENINRCRGKSY